MGHGGCLSTLTLWMHLEWIVLSNGCYLMPPYSTESLSLVALQELGALKERIPGRNRVDEHFRLSWWPSAMARFDSANKFDGYFKNTIAIDAEYCKQIGILYMLTICFQCLVGTTSKMGHQQSTNPHWCRFLWRQAYWYISDPNINTLYLAQFDEVDEGTAIFKVTAKTSDYRVQMVDGWL